LLKRTAKLLSKIVSLLPESFVRMLAESFGLLLWLFWVKERLRLKREIDRIYFRMRQKPPMPVDLIVKRTFIHFAYVFFDFLRIPAYSFNDFKSKFSIEGLKEILDEHVNNGKGLIFVLPHIGNWELLGAFLAHGGYPLNSFYMAQKEDLIGELIEYFRSFTKIRLHDRDRGLAGAYRALLKGGFLAMIADQDGSDAGVYMDFLGHWVSVPPGPANWSIKAKVPIYLIYSLRKPGTFTYEGKIFKLDYEDLEGLSHQEAVIKVTQIMAQKMERIILEYPDNYLWFYDRFKPRHEAKIAKYRQERGQMTEGVPQYGL